MQLHAKPMVAFDSNMLLAVQQLKVDVISEARKRFGGKARLVVPRQVLLELKGLENGGKKLKKAAAIALQEVERHLEIVDVDAENADAALEKMAREGYLVATNDAVLRKRIKGFAGRVIYLRQKHFLESD